MKAFAHEQGELVQRELIALFVGRLPLAAVVSGIGLLLPVLFSGVTLDHPLVLAWLVLVVAVVAGRLLMATALGRQCREEGEIDPQALSRHRLLVVACDGALWLAGAGLCLTVGGGDVGPVLVGGLLLALGLSVAYGHDPATALAASGAVLAGTMGTVAIPGISRELVLFAVAAPLVAAASYYCLLQFQRLLVDAIAARGAAEQAAGQEREANEVYVQLWHNTPLAAIEWDARFRITRWNPSAAAMFGYSKEEALGQPLELIFDKEDLEKTKRKWRALWRRKVGLRSIHRCRNKQGETVFCEWNDAAIMRNGQSVGISSFVDNITAQTQAEDVIRKQANYDSLTGLPNRRQMMAEIRRAIQRCRREKSVSALVFIDLDHFKDINDTQGHDVGDLVLKAFARRVSENVRESDLVARFGGDEFVVLLENVGTNVQQAAQHVETITNKLLTSGSGLCRIGDIDYDLDVSGGIVLFDGAWDENEILKKADLAMYRVKNEGRKGMAFYDESLTIETEYRVELIRGLRHGLENNEFKLHYQPIVEKDGSILYSEALLRWQRPSSKIVPAGHFIDIMSSSPMMGTVGYWIIDRVCQDINELRDAGQWREGQAMFVNISPRQLMDVGFAGKVKMILESNGVDPTWIVFEITEDSLIHNYDDVLGQLKELIGIGIRLALDDFGTGYSSLAMLKDLPVHYVKLDREFVKSLFQNQNNYLIVNAIIKLCEILSLKVIAEGIEEENQFSALKRMSCDYYQGFMFHKPMALEQLMAELEPGTTTVASRPMPEHLRLVE